MLVVRSGSTISGAISVIVGYLCDCCLGWVFYRKDKKATRAFAALATEFAELDKKSKKFAKLHSEVEAEAK